MTFATLSSNLTAMGVLSLLVSTIGCREAPPAFEINQVRAMSLERSRDVPTEAALSDVALVIDQLFGTPQMPLWPSDLLETAAAKNLVSVERLMQSAGAVTSDNADAHTGLYQEHCVICHGISGGGNGPASRYQVPYPRDFRPGIFKWKSTPRNAKPTRKDLLQVIEKGIPGSPMPRFTILPPSERESIIDYVIYLSVRGEVERELLAVAVDDLEYDTTAPAEDLRLTTISFETQGQDSSHGQELMRKQNVKRKQEATRGQVTVTRVVREIAESWCDAAPSSVPAEPEMDGGQLRESIARGKALFHGPVANCVGCHGEAGRGELPLLDYDDWTKDFTTRVGVTPDDSDAVRPFRNAGALPPRKIDPRRLAEGTLRGGADPQSIYRRINHGIAGTPMPALKINDSDDGNLGITPAQAWDLVHYVRELCERAVSY